MTASFITAAGAYVFTGSSAASAPDNSFTVSGCYTYLDSFSNSDQITVNNIVNPGQVMDTSAFSIFLYALDGDGGAEHIIAQDTS